MFDINLLIVVIIADLAVELPIIAVLVLWINPKRSAAKVKDSLVNDDDFRTDLVQFLTEDMFKPIKWRDDKGNTISKEPVSIISDHMLAGMKSWINGKQSEMTQELEKNATESMSAMPDNPLMALALQQIPKKYRAYIQIAANLFNQNK